MFSWLGIVLFLATLLNNGSVTTSSTKRLELQHGKTTIVSVRFTRDGRRLISASLDGTVAMWDSQSAKLIWKVDLDHRSKTTKTSHTISEISGMDFALGTGTVAVSYSRGRAVGDTLHGKDEYRIGLLDSLSGREGKVLTGHADQIGRIAFSPNGELLLSESADKSARLWNVQSGQQLLTIKLKEKGAAVAFSPNGKVFAVATQPVWGLPPQPIVGLYDAQTGRLIREFARRKNVVTSLAFSADGQVLAIAGGDASGAQVDVWELSAKEPKATFPEPRREVNSVVFSPDARLLALGGYANGHGFVEMHDLTNGQIRTYSFGSDVTSLDFSPDGKRLVVGTDKGQIALLELQAH